MSKDNVLSPKNLFTAQKLKFSIEGFFSKCDQIRSFLQIWSNLLKKSLMEKFIFCTMIIFTSNLSEVKETGKVF